MLPGNEKSSSLRGKRWQQKIGIPIPEHLERVEILLDVSEERQDGYIGCLRLLQIIC